MAEFAQKRVNSAIATFALVAKLCKFRICKSYQMAIGCLTYATTATRPDLAAAVGILSKYMSRPDHWQEVKRVLRYIKETLNYGLAFTANGSDPSLYGHSDAD